MSMDAAPTITEFLLARIAEDEANAGNYVDFFPEGDMAPLFRRILAECSAKRAIVEMQAANDEDRHQPGFHYKAQTIEDILRTLATVYADHPDYRARWAPRG